MIKDLVILLEQAKKLKEIGYEKESLFYWSACHECEMDLWYIKESKSSDYDQYSAFTAQELWDLTKDCHFQLWKEHDGSFLYYQPESGTDNSYRFSGNNIAELLAEMLIAKALEDSLEK